MSRMPWIKLACIALVAFLFIHFDLQNSFTLEYLQQRQHDISVYYALHPWRTRAIYFVLYLGCASLSMPGTLVLTLAAGATFGLTWGVALVSFATAIGGTVAFWSARYLFRESLQKHYGERLARINQNFAAKGHWYLFTLRLIPVLPYFLINLAMGLTNMSTRTFYAMTQLGMLAGTLAYVNAGLQLSQMHQLSDVLSARLLGAFALLAVIPLSVLVLGRSPDLQRQ